MAYNRWGDAFAPSSWGSAWGTGEAPSVDNLVAQNIVIGAPVIAEPLAEILYELLGAEISTGGPSISSPSMTFISAIATGGVVTGVPQVGNFGAFRYTLEAMSLLTGGPYAAS